MMKDDKTSTELALKNRREFRRRSVLWPGELRFGRHHFSCQVWNLSLGGARIRVEVPLQVGTEVTLYMPDRGEAVAVVAWAKGNTLGIRFLCPASDIRRMFADRLQVLGLESET